MLFIFFTWLTLGPSYNETVLLHLHSYIALFVVWARFNYFITLNPHSTKCTPTPMMCNNFTISVSLFAWLFSLAINTRIKPTISKRSKIMTRSNVEYFLNKQINSFLPPILFHFFQTFIKRLIQRQAIFSNKNSKNINSESRLFQ